VGEQAVPAGDRLRGAIGGLIAQGKFTPGKCPLSGHSDWHVAEDAVELRPYRGGGLVVGSGPIYVCAMLVCKGCGLSLLFNVRTLGIVTDPPAGMKAPV